MSLRPPPDPNKVRVKVRLHADETIMNQCASAAMNQGRDLDWFKGFMARVERVDNIDDALRLLFADFEVSADDGYIGS